MTKNVLRILKVPRTIEEIIRANELYARLVAEVPIRQNEFPGLYNLFKVLDKYQIEIAPEIRKMVFDLDTEWENYLKKLMEAEELLDYTREDFKKNLTGQGDKFRTLIKEFFQDFVLKLPSSASM